MNMRMTILLAALGAFIPLAQAQTNCCEIQVGAVQLQGTYTVVPGSQGGTYILSQTQTYPIACINTQSGKACSSSSSTSNNMVTATGTGAYSTALGHFVACNPSFMPMTTDATATTGGSFMNTGTSYTSVDSDGNCVASPNNPYAMSNCIIVACSGGGSGGGRCGKDGGECDCGSPILIDVSGNGFFLTSAQNGVRFDLSGTGNAVQMAWTAPGAANAFLALPGPDGQIHSGKQLFGNFTPQPPSENPNGFAALAVYDDPANGGNGDGVIDSRDAIFTFLRLWIDTNHDGIAQPEELHTLRSLGVYSISLNYKVIYKTDQYGNAFRYRARVTGNDEIDRWAYDVFLVIESPTGKLCPMAPPPSHDATAAKGGQL